MAENLERAYLGSVADMGTYACAGVIVPYPDYPECFRGIRGQFAQVDNLCSLAP